MIHILQKKLKASDIYGETLKRARKPQRPLFKENPIE